ncbi:hypothetical protein QFC19_005499 [Naganishia cerealis]|uniref:Uncharacterized protein n=1 Tax=Naganishia cerealis TaxID=610337 RepID=A0ACC2VNV3_9TREE|nr:hypothetical protein QFC19_005499 [Naganishia cerealis]
MVQMQGLTSPPRTPRSTNDPKSVRSHAPVTPLCPSPTPQQPKYSHPYGIQSTSSGVLSSSRGTSSPNTVISTHSYQQHKSNQSMRSLLRNSSSVDDLAQSASGNSELAHSSNKENIEQASLLGRKYDSVRTRKRTLAQRASMSDLSTMVRDTPGEWETDISASPRKHVAEMRAALLKGDTTGSRSKVCRSSDRRPELGEWQRELDNLSVRLLTV